jgi:hypothetical protein
MTAVVASSADEEDEDPEELPPELPVVVMPLRVVVPENAGCTEEMATRRLRLSEVSDAG